MNATLPTGIEHSLREAGFSATEMLVLRHLVESEALTVREIANKTGKSTGVLDQSMKKLMGKKIVERTVINDQPRYRIRSLDSILRWLRQDMEERQASMQRQHLSIQQFLSSLKVDRVRPDMEYFQGQEGIEQAYLKLLESGGELLTQSPILTTAEDDPLRAFRVDYFRKRQYRKIFQRVIAPDTSLARRFQSRDHFEYRKTVLVPQSEFPLSFEKTIVGDTVACINHTEQSACFIRYPELAKTERLTFETAWARAVERENAPALPSSSLTPTVVPVKTRVLSSVREFFLSKKSIATLCVFGVVCGAITFGLYRQNYSLNLKRLRERAMSITATGAMQFDATDLDQLRTIDDIKKPEYAKVIKKLNQIRSENEGVTYAWIMRPAKDKKGYWEYVADADSIDPFAKIDSNFDGVIDEKDALQYPGLPYDEFDQYFGAGLKETFSTPEIHYDNFGTYFTTTSPIRRNGTESIAMFGVDIKIENVSILTKESFNYLLFFTSAFLLFVFIRFTAVNRSLMQECWTIMKRNMRQILLWITFLILSGIAVIYGFRQYTHQLLVEQTGKRLLAIAVTAATEFDPNDFTQLHFAGDMRTEAYQRVFRKLNEIRDKNPEIKFAYIFRPVDNEGMFEFVGDADSNFDLPFLTKYDAEDTSPFTSANENVYPGMRYFDFNSAARNELKKAGYDITPGKWGNLLTGASPIYDSSGRAVALLGFDVDLTKIAR